MEDENEIRLQTPTHMAEGHPLFENEPGSGQDSGASSPEPNNEDNMFTLLFQECDTDGTGEIEVERLISYIRKVRLGQEHGDKEEVYDSQEDIPAMQYDLHLLKAMLECNSTEDGKVEQQTFTHITKMWVRDIRNRNVKSAPSEPLEVSELSDSPDHEEEGAHIQEVSYGSYATGGGDESHESFETSGGLSTSHTEHERIDLINSLADLKLDNKRLQEMNKALQLQMEHSEENLKEIQSENKELKQQIKEFQANLVRLEQVEGENSEMMSDIEREKRRCQQLTAKVDKQQKDIANLQEDLKSARSQLTVFELDRSKLTEESNTLRLLLLQKEELLSQQETTCAQMEAQLQLETQRVKELSHTLDEVKLSRDELKSENSDLQTQVRLSRVRGKQPLSSTPYRPSAPSWHEELMEQESLTSKSSPILPPRRRDDVEDVVNGVNGEVGGSGDVEVEEISPSESFTKILEETNLKINEKHNQLVHGLSDLINQPSPVASHHSVENNSRVVIHEKPNDRSMQSFESKLADLLRKKKKAEKENDRLSALVEKLKKRLADLEKSQVANGNGPPTGEEDLDTVASAERVAPVQEYATEAYRDQDASSRLLFPTSASTTPPAHLRRRPKLSRSTIKQVDFDGCAPSLSLSSSPSAGGPSSEKSQQTDPSVVSSGIEELAFQKAYSSALRESTNKELADLKERQDDLTSHCAQLEQRARKLQDQKTGWLRVLGSSAYRILKSVALLLLVVFCILSIIVLFVALMDLLGTCGSHCPRSPAYVFYSQLGSYLQYTRTTSPI